MTLLQSAPIWLLFAALAIPLACVGWAARRFARDIAATADYSTKTTSKGPVVYNTDGTISQSFSIEWLKSVTGQVKVPFGPISVTANAREWAANSLLLGLLLVIVGMCGLFHFPTTSSASPSDQPQNDTGVSSVADVDEKREGK